MKLTLMHSEHDESVMAGKDRESQQVKKTADDQIEQHQSSISIAYLYLQDLPRLPIPHVSTAGGRPSMLGINAISSPTALAKLYK